MRVLPRAASFFRTLFRKSRVDQELSDELDAYVAALTRKKVREGLDPAEARRAAVIEIGGMDALEEKTRDARAGMGFETAVRDVRLAWRALRKSPAFALATVLTLGLGIGANTAIFSLVNAMLLTPLPYRDSSRLVFVWSDMSEAGYPRAPLSGPELADLRRRAKLFSGFGAIWANSAALTGEGDPEQLRVGLVTTDFFDVLGAAPAYGRTFRDGDDAPGAPTTVVLSAPLWRRRFGGDPAIVGRRIQYGGEPATVIGVMPDSFRLWMPPDAAVPDDLQAFATFWPKMTDDPRGQQFLRVVGRLKPGVTVAQGKSEIDAIAARISREFPDYGSAGRRFDAVGLHADGVREIRPTLLALFGGVGILLLLTCVNVAGLLAARAASRREEIALKIALGAGRGRLFRQCLAEGLVLAALGAAAGVLVARLVLALLFAARPESLQRITAARIDGKVLAFTAATALLWGVLLSLAPLAEVRRTRPVANLKRGGDPSRARTRAAFVATQIALGVVLVVGAVLVARTFVRLQQVDPGFRSDHALSFRLALPGARYGEPAKFNAFSRRFEEELAAIPGVAAAGAVSHLPFDHIPNWGGPYLAAARPPDGPAPMADYRAVSPRFFETVGARLVGGRHFTEADDEKSAPVVIVDERLARLAWPGETAVGKKLLVDPGSKGQPTIPATVVGVVRHLRDRSLLSEVREQVYFPQRQIQRNPAAYVIRAFDDAGDLTAAIRRVLEGLDPALPISEVRPLADYLSDARGAQRFTMLLAAAFAAVALLLAAVGLYGVVAYSVAQRRKEFGVRLALGAVPRQIRVLVVSEGARIAATGLAFGVPAAIVAARLLRSQLFGVTPGDPLSYAAAIGLLSLAAIGASYVASRRASGANALEALRSE